MPGLNRTGPLGEGPRTGRALGKCGKAQDPQRLDVGRGSQVRPGSSAPTDWTPRRGGGRGRVGSKGHGFRAGPVQNRICPSCGERVVHNLGSPCFDQKCPKCGTAMIGE